MIFRALSELASSNECLWSNTNAPEVGLQEKKKPWYQHTAKICPGQASFCRCFWQVFFRQY